MDGNSPDVIGLGQCSLDFLGKVDCYPGLDQKTELSSLLVQGGGPVATALVTLARLGVATEFIGAIGDDEYGEKIHQGLTEEHVGCKYLVEKAGCKSQVAFITVDLDGNRNIFWHRGEALPQLPKDFETTLKTGVKILHLDGLHHDVAMTAASAARRCRVTTVLDAGTFRSQIVDLLPLVDHLIVSEKFARECAGDIEINDILNRLISYGGEVASVTCGNAGCYSLNRNGEFVFQPAFSVEAIDTTGCGDVFHGGYIYGLLQKWPLQQRVRFAAACAALKTGEMGGRTAIPSLQEVNQFLSLHHDVERLL